MMNYSLADAAEHFRHSQLALGLIGRPEHVVWCANDHFARAVQVLHVATHRNPLTELPALQQCMAQCVAQQSLTVWEHAGSQQRWECLPVQVLQPDGSSAQGVQCSVLALDTVDAATQAGEAQAWRRMLEQSPHSSWACSLGGEVYWTNRSSNLYTYGQPEALDLSNSRYIHKIHPDDLQHTSLLFSKAMAEGHLAAPFRYRLRNHLGEYHWFLFTAAPVRGDDGTVLHWAGSSIQIDDIVAAEQAQQAHIHRLSTQRERLHTRLREAQALMANVHKMDLVAHLAGGVAHDLNNLLFVTGIHLSVLDKKVQDPALLERLHAVRDCSRKAARLSSQLSGFSGRLPQNATGLHPTEVVQELHDLLRQAAGAEADFQLEVTDAAHTIHVDRTYLENALLNLVINARDAADGRGQVRLRVANCHLPLSAAATSAGSAHLPGDYVAFSVSDNGQGMTPEVRQRIFEPFFTTKAAGKGTGLGLSMVKNFVDNSQGFMEVESSPGQGSTLTLYLPLSHATVEHAHEEEEALLPGREAVMLIEDDPSVRQAVASFLCELGYDLSTANDPTQAIMLLRRGVKVDAIISDVKMPGQKTVLDLIAHVEAHHPVPIIFSTGYSDNIAIHEGQIAGRYPVLFKPFAIGALVAKLREVLQQPQPAHADATSTAATAATATQHR